MYPKKVNLFDLDMYIEGKLEITNLINQKLKEKNLNVRQLAKKINISNPTIYRFLNGKSMRGKNLYKIIMFLGIQSKTIENFNPFIYSGPYKYRKYDFKFPISLSPMHIRLVSHFLGDGSLEKCHCRWYQKSDVGGGCIIELIKQLSGIAIEKGSKDSYGIPIILGDIVAKSLMLKRSELKSSLFVKKVNDLPKEYKIQLLAAFIVDEGSISKSSIKVCNTNLLILKSLRKIMLSLGYNCSKVKNYGDHVGGEIFIKYRKARINYQIYNLYMHADGLLKFKKDLDIMIKKYGNIAGLWQKQDILSKFSLKVDLNKINKSRISKKHLIPLIEKEIAKGPIFIKEFAKRNDLDYIRAYKLFFRLKEKGKIKKVSPGMFVSKDYNGPIDFTLKSKIEKLLKEEFSLKEITSLTNANLKSVSAQLSRFCNEGKIKRIKCGIYSLS